MHLEYNTSLYHIYSTSSCQERPAFLQLYTYIHCCIMNVFVAHINF